MGGRGGRSGISTGYSKDGSLSTKLQTIETVYTEGRGFSRGRYSDEVLEATTDGKGNITFSYAKGGEFEKTAKTNRRNTVTYKLAAGSVNGETFGVNWSKVNSISGQTYGLRNAAKNAGLKWDGKNKRWVR